MAMNAYLERVRQARKSVQERISNELPKAKELLGKTVTATTSAGFKTTRAASNGYALASSKARSAVNSDEVKHLARIFKGTGLGASQSLSKPDEPNDEKKIQHAILKLSGKDKFGIAGEHLSAVGGAAAGVAAAGTVAGAAGATTLLGSGALAGVFGGVFLTATPVGWVIGSAAVMGAAGYGIGKMIRSGSEQDITRQEMVKRLSERLVRPRPHHQKTSVDCRTKLSRLVTLTVAAGAISEESANRMVSLVEAGALKPELALERINSIAISKGLLKNSE